MTKPKKRPATVVALSVLQAEERLHRAAVSQLEGTRHQLYESNERAERYKESFEASARAHTRSVDKYRKLVDKQRALIRDLGAYLAALDEQVEVSGVHRGITIQQIEADAAEKAGEPDTYSAEGIRGRRGQTGHYSRHLEPKTGETRRGWKP